MIKLSKRMKAAASMVTTGNVLADIGTDHGYVPIALVQRGRIPSAIAMDINKGPLEKAREHIVMCNLQDKIETRLSDGTKALTVGEADSILIAGMGGELVLHILREGEAVCHSAKELVLQPQSDVHKVREYLRNNGYLIKRPGADYNSPTQKSMELGLFEIKETVVAHTNDTRIHKTSKITGKGQRYFVNKFLNKDM